MRLATGSRSSNPHGDYAEKMLDLIPARRTDDVIYLNPADLEHPVGFNIMELVGEAERPLVLGGLLAIFKKLWPDAWSPRMEYFLANALLVLLEAPRSTLLDVNRLFADRKFRDFVLPRVKDPIVRAFWEKEYAGLSE